MKTHAQRKGHILHLRGIRIWSLFGVLSAVFAWAAIVGTRPAYALAACTSAQCSDAHNYALNVCVFDRGSNVGGFLCPLNNETDDFFFICGDGYHEKDDCSTGNPS